MDILHEDWVQGPHLRFACAQLLVGCILVDQEQILLVNCNEVYGRLRTLDAHYERFQNNYSSMLPDENISVYQDICVCNVDEDNSHKLIIESFVFSLLITLRARLDGDNKPEVNHSTFNFKSTGKTKNISIQPFNSKSNSYHEGTSNQIVYPTSLFIITSSKILFHIP
ncbi:uncharacterized protein BX663DRAFT_506579 [Cokeromyces recurvatus]|uniref:uncharacterized protein n=1 Tax=Cokeromyces recurvatus TaxID=90255 RepID=UPI00221EA754|nr:uncharacterized protein BX663DRAFT_506579 [Cokeromyces recurvatus]KAI7903460.1 hypothetical protein BX663DRAFT_506579 [Cokeromyces recurvatus]